MDLRHSFEKSIKIDKISKEIGYILYIKVLKMCHKSISLTLILVVLGEKHTEKYNMYTF